MINCVDEFIIYDEMQYTKRDWRNRNQILTPQGPIWLTIPVKVKGKFTQKINETEVEGTVWAEKHWKTLEANYKKTPYFTNYSSELKRLYELSAKETQLSVINLLFLKKLNSILGINTYISSCTDYNLIEGQSERLVDLCQKAKASTYISGPAAKNYLREDIFEENSISVCWMNYQGYPEYRQHHNQFNNFVSILDLLFNEGPNAQKFMKSFSKMRCYDCKNS